MPARSPDHDRWRLPRALVTKDPLGTNRSAPGAREALPNPGPESLRERWDDPPVPPSPAGSDERPLAVVISELQQLGRGAPVPLVTLTDRPCSRAYPGRPWRPARVAIRRQLAARGPSSALQGEIAHEYVHVLRPDSWRHVALFVLATELGAVGLAIWLLGVIASWIDHAHAPLWLGPGSWAWCRCVLRSLPRPDLPPA